MKTAKLNVGCGRNPQPGDDWVNVDIYPAARGVLQWDAQLWPPPKTVIQALDGRPVEEFWLSHVLEHVSQPLALMENLWKLAAPNALCRIWVPHGGSDRAWEDQTHVRAYFPGSFLAFQQPYYWRADYGYQGDWRVLELGLCVTPEYKDLCDEDVLKAANTHRNVVGEIAVNLEAVKPARPPNPDLLRKPPVRILR